MCKPTKNRVMCPECGRAKMLFESESKARNFIKFNGDNIPHNGELRTYFCPACGGYHISSKEHKRSYDTATDRLINAYRTMKNVPTLDDINALKDCYELLVQLNLRRRRDINQELRSDKFQRFHGTIKEKAKLKYYKEFNL